MTSPRADQATIEFTDSLVVDADSHVLEPPDLWERYMDPDLRDRAIRIRTDSRLKRRPSEIFRSQCWISADPDEKTVQAIIDLVGDDRFLWASDYPHSEAKPGIMHDLYELTSRMNERARENLVGASAARLYKIKGRRSRGH